MARIYERVCNNGIKVGLYKRTDTTDLPYVVKRGNAIIVEAANLGDANREYHSRVAKEDDLGIF